MNLGDKLSLRWQAGLATCVEPPCSSETSGEPHLPEKFSLLVRLFFFWGVLTFDIWGRVCLFVVLFLAIILDCIPLALFVFLLLLSSLLLFLLLLDGLDPFFDVLRRHSLGLFSHGPELLPYPVHPYLLHLHIHPEIPFVPTPVDMVKVSLRIL